jgi:two-component system, cell cycle sensor histidine kinase and response regulator CckA
MSQSLASEESQRPAAGVLPAEPSLFMDAFPDALIVMDFDLRVVQANASAAVALGRIPAELIGTMAAGIFSPTLHTALTSACRRASAESRPVEHLQPLSETSTSLWRFRVHAGVSRYSILFWEVAGEETASVVRRAETGSSRRDAEAEKREKAAGHPGGGATTDARFEMLVDPLEIGVYIVRERSIVYANAHLRKIFGLSVEEMAKGVSLTDLIVEEDRPTLVELIRSSPATGASMGRRMLRGTRRDGTPVEVEVQGRRTQIEGAPVFIGIAIDVTERERAAAALREREEQLRHAQKLDAVGRLAGGIAHDFNNLLMVIQGSVNLILMDAETENPHQQDLREIVRATQRAAELTRQLLAFGRKQVLRPKVLSINTTVEDLNKMIGRVLGADVELRTELASDLSCVRVDPGQLEQVILNLIVNARDAMPAGGVLTLRTEHWTLTEEDSARAPYRVIPGPYVRLTVSDTGFGMPQSVLNQAFEPFFTTKARSKGSGLGLSTAYGIVKQSSGYIWITSQPGRGTSIEIYLPRVDEAAETLRTLLPENLPRGTGCILIVEDEEPVRVVTRRLLEMGGYRVIEAAGGTEAVQRYDESSAEIDLVLTDVVMPQMGGHELATHLRARNPSIRLLYMSGYADNRSVRRGSAGEGDDFIQKPFTPETLLARVGSLLRS